MDLGKEVRTVEAPESEPVEVPLPEEPTPKPEREPVPAG